MLFVILYRKIRIFVANLRESMAKQKKVKTEKPIPELEVKAPKIVNEILTFETRFFMLDSIECEIVSTNLKPHEITYKKGNERYTKSASVLRTELCL